MRPFQPLLTNAVVDSGVAEAVRRLAQRQKGTATYTQLLAVGVTRSHIRTRVRRGDWQRPYPHVYVLGDPELLPLALPSAALLSLGPTAALGHRTAVEMCELIAPSPHPIDVVLPSSNARPRPGVRIHLVTDLHRADLTYRHNLRMTTPGRSLIDFAIEASSSELEHAVSKGVAERVLREEGLDAALARAPLNHSGAARIRARLRADPELFLHTRSVAERILYPFVLKADLPRPLLNRVVHGHRVDLLWPDRKVIVEFDGWDSHKSRIAFENDRRRDQQLTAAGYRVLRVTWLQMHNQPLATIASIAQVLAIGGAIAA